MATHHIPEAKPGFTSWGTPLVTNSAKLDEHFKKDGTFAGCLIHLSTEKAILIDKLNKCIDVYGILGGREGKKIASFEWPALMCRHEEQYGVHLYHFPLRYNILGEQEMGPKVMLTIEYTDGQYSVQIQPYRKVVEE